ncbi:MAG: hypothetical protein MUO22_04020, partial [Sedimentisphaerales bacterium]|nr:hypothetical protein [Sedimentisphaerales bacterium]
MKYRPPELVSGQFRKPLEPGQADAQGYQLVEKRFVKEVNAECLLLEHTRSGAKILKIASDDPNKTFSIAFKT